MKRGGIAILTMLLLAGILGGCGKSEFRLSENTAKQMTIEAENAAKGAYFMVGALEAEAGDQIVITSDLSKVSVRVEIVGTPGTQKMEDVPDVNGKVVISTDLSGTEVTSDTVQAGSYILEATCLQKATGTVLIEVVPANP